MATYNGHNEDASGNILLSIGNGMTATLETGTTASQAYTKGAYLYYNNRLCKVTSAIASGNTLTIGTNIAYTTLGEELTSHLKATNGDEFYFDYKDGEPGYYPSASKTASEFVPIGGTESEITVFRPGRSSEATTNPATCACTKCGVTTSATSFKNSTSGWKTFTFQDYSIQLSATSASTGNSSVRVTPPKVGVKVYNADTGKFLHEYLDLNYYTITGNGTRFLFVLP